ncbi:MAG: TPM domain-containing protein, partial [Asticcacaulis sp.]
MNQAFKSFWVAFAVLLLASTGGAAFADPTFPALNNQRVVDDAHLLSDATRADLTAKLKGLEDATTDQVVIVTVPDLQGYEISDYGYQLGRHWGIGQSGKVEASNGQTYKDNGILLIVAPNERKVRIEVGYGLEPVMTDAMSSIIIQRAILPQFKAGDYEAGIVAGTDSILQQLSLERGVAIQKAEEAKTQLAENPQKGFPLPAIIFILILLFMFSRGWLPWFLLGSLL